VASSLGRFPRWSFTCFQFVSIRFGVVLPAAYNFPLAWYAHIDAHGFQFATKYSRSSGHAFSHELVNTASSESNVDFVLQRWKLSQQQQYKQHNQQHLTQHIQQHICKSSSRSTLRMPLPLRRAASSSDQTSLFCNLAPIRQRVKLTENPLESGNAFSRTCHSTKSLSITIVVIFLHDGFQSLNNSIMSFVVRAF
jgi:hypothetical protein